MEFRFTLCPECQEKYGALRFDPAASQYCSIMPLCSLFWPDEHPNAYPDGDPYVPFFMWPLDEHKECRDSIIRLAFTRTKLWRMGTIPTELEELWEEAHRVIPEWPGFRRLSLDCRQLESLDGCAEELGNFMDVIQQDFPHVVTADEGVGLSRFTASREGVPAPMRDDEDDEEIVSSASRWIRTGASSDRLCGDLHLEREAAPKYSGVQRRREPSE